MSSVVVQNPVNTTVCQGDNATFTCVVLISSGILSTPGWSRNGVGVGVTDMRQAITSDLMSGGTAPVNISSTITVSNVTVLDDNGALYQCGLRPDISNSATLNVVVGKCAYVTFNVALMTYKYCDNL